MTRPSATVSCALGALVVAGTAMAGQDRPARVTFTQHIAPIVFANCSSCHRADGSAPFSLTTYAEVKAHAPQIVDVTKRRSMPPWKPEPGVGDFVGVRRLSDEQITLIGR